MQPIHAPGITLTLRLCFSTTQLCDLCMGLPPRMLSDTIGAADECGDSSCHCLALGASSSWQHHPGET